MDAVDVFDIIPLPLFEGLELTEIVLLSVGQPVAVELLLGHEDALELTDLENFGETDFEGEAVCDRVLYTVSDNREDPVCVLDIAEDGDTVLLFFLVAVLSGESVADRLIIPLFVANTDFVIVVDAVELLLLLDDKVPVLEFVVDAVLLEEVVIDLLIGAVLLLVEEAV